MGGPFGLLVYLLPEVPHSFFLVRFVQLAVRHFEFGVAFACCVLPHLGEPIIYWFLNPRAASEPSFAKRGALIPFFAVDVADLFLLRAVFDSRV